MVSYDSIFVCENKCVAVIGSLGSFSSPFLDERLWLRGFALGSAWAEGVGE